MKVTWTQFAGMAVVVTSFLLAVFGLRLATNTFRDLDVHNKAVGFSVDRAQRSVTESIDAREAITADLAASRIRLEAIAKRIKTKPVPGRAEQARLLTQLQAEQQRLTTSTKYEVAATAKFERSQDLLERALDREVTAASARSQAQATMSTTMFGLAALIFSGFALLLSTRTRTVGATS